MSNRKSRSFTFTILNWTEEHLVSCLDILDEAIYSVIGFETCPTTKTPHIQGYVYFKNERYISAIIKKFKVCNNAHIEIARGSPKQNRAYCIKDGEYNEFGQLPEQGKRTDLLAFKDTILNGDSTEQLLETFSLEMAQYDRFYQKCLNLRLKKQANYLYQNMDKEQLEITVIIGPPGCGKTRVIYDNYDINDIYKLEIGDGSTGSVFWNGYEGESIILIDDFHSNLKLDYMLRLLDIYPMRLNTKGGYTYRTAKKIFITSNIEIDNWYPNCHSRHREAIKRRITKLINLNFDAEVSGNTGAETSERKI